MPNNSLVSTEGLTRPATVLIEKISEAVGAIYEPRQIRQVAQAKADAAMTLAKGEMEINVVKRRALQRFVDEETRNQQNMESIVAKTIPVLDDNAPTQDVESDWITNFFDKCRSVSDHEMQLLWSRILTGEANAPGSFSRKTVNLVADLDKASAKLFHTLCSFGWQFGDTFAPLILDFGDRTYNQRGIFLFSLGELDAIGLIQISGTTGFVLHQLPKRITATYHDQSVELTLPNDSGNELKVGKVIMTPSGMQLSRIVKPDPVEGFFEFIYDKWAGDSLVPPREDRT